MFTDCEILKKLARDPVLEGQIAYEELCQKLADDFSKKINKLILDSILKKDKTKKSKP